MQNYLKRKLNFFISTVKRFTTLLWQIELSLNMRFIAALHDNLENFDISILFIDSSLKVVLMPSFLEIEDNRLSRW